MRDFQTVARAHARATKEDLIIGVGIVEPNAIDQKQRLVRIRPAQKKRVDRPARSRRKMRRTGREPQGRRQRRRLPSREVRRRNNRHRRPNSLRSRRRARGRREDRIELGNGRTLRHRPRRQSHRQHPDAQGRRLSPRRRAKKKSTCTRHGLRDCARHERPRIEEREVMDFHR